MICTGCVIVWKPSSWTVSVYSPNGIVVTMN